MRKLELVGFLLIILPLLGCSAGLVAGYNGDGIILSSMVFEFVGSIVFLIGRFSR